MSLTMCVTVALAGAQSLPSGAELVARHVAAIGGAEAIGAVTSYRATGVTEVPLQGITGTFEVIAARPDKSIMRMEIAGLGATESGYNGDVGWLLDPMVGPSIATGAVLAEMRNEARFDAVLHPPDLVASATTTARTEFDGHPAYRVHVVFVSGQELDELFDVDSGLLIGIIGDSATPMGTLPLTVTLRDYKAFGALKHPARLIQAAMGIEQHFVFERYEYDGVPSEAFATPTIIEAIIKREPTASVEPAWRTEALASFDEAWNTINDTFYDPSFGGIDWPGVRDELRPRVRSAATPTEARRVIASMLARLKRSHFVLLPAAGATALETDPPAPTGGAAVEIDLRVLGREVVVTNVAAGSPAARAGISAGQILVGVDDRDARDWWDTSATSDADRDSRHDPRVTSLQVWRRAEASLRGRAGSKARVRVLDGGDSGERVIEVERTREEGTIVTLGNLPSMHTRVSSQAVRTVGGRTVGVIGFNVWMTPIGDPVARAVDEYRSSDGLVIDLRGNPGGLAAMIQGVAGHLFATPELLGRMTTRTSTLEFRANPRRVTPDGKRVEPYGGPVAILVDELTGSASECFVGALQSLGRARVFGRQTMGQALPASTRRLPNGDVLMYVVGDFVTASGQRLEGAGVQPDEDVPLSVSALRAGHDATLEAALRWLDTQ